jgi:tagatose 1,6-diphosphate aldolase
MGEEETTECTTPEVGRAVGGVRTRKEEMDGLSPGKLRGLQQIADGKGILTVCAIDHRESLRRALNEKNPDAVSYRDMVQFKLDLCRVVSPLASAVLLDPIYGAGQAVLAGALSGRIGLLVSIEMSGYSGEATARITRLLPGWGVRKIKRMGASAVKLLIYFRPDIKDLASRQLELVKELADDCIREDIPLLVESVAYPTAAEKTRPEEFSRKKPDLVLEAARQLTALPIDILKSEFPADIGYEKDAGRLQAFCRQLTQVSRLPWVLLSAGVSYDEFKKEVEIACKAGASGFMAGRALWQEATRVDSREERLRFFENHTVARLKELADMADAWGTPWYARMGHEDGKFPEVPQGWYKNY